MKVIWSQWRNRWAAFLHDFLCIPIAWLGAFWLRFNLTVIPSEILTHALHLLPLLLLFQTFAFWFFGLYRGVWRFASLPDLTRIIKAIVTGSLLTLLAIFLLSRLQNLPRSVIPLYSMLLIFILGGSRFIYRWSKDKPYISQNAQRVLIVGAGVAGESLVRDLLRDRKSSFYLPVAFVDDHIHKQGRELHGIRVVGSCDDIIHIVKAYHVDMILIALPSANAAQMRRIVGICESTQKPVRTLPGTNDLVSGFVSVKNLREISLEDLLGRDPIILDWQAIRNVFATKVVLVSGGGGSIGSELCRQIMQLKPDALIIIDNSEYNLFCIEQELIENFPQNKSIQYHLIDLCDHQAIENIMKKTKPHIIFHAAAYKHVPLLEPQVRAAVKNNVMGTYHLAKSAIIYGVERFILVSTDKAVNPTNVMGATKRIAECVCQYFNEQRKTRFMTVRFGNVLGSRGSVVETFKRQLEKGGPLTVTHPEVMRYFMTVQEASQLILQALAIGQGGELFVLDMGEPVKISYLAEQMVKLSVTRKEEDIQIEYIGLRPGEKLYEELFHHREELGLTTHSKILKAFSRKIEAAAFVKNMMALEKAIEVCEDEEVYKLMKELVPELNRSPITTEVEMELNV